jgi:hypothetical protein
MMIEMKSSRRPRHTKGCSAKEEEEEDIIKEMMRCLSIAANQNVASK